jgi:hypothetical protein
MALIAGSAVDGTGLAGALAAERKKVCPKMVLKDAAPYIDADAKAIIDYLVANAEVEVAEAPGGTTLTPPGIGTIK